MQGIHTHAHRLPHLVHSHRGSFREDAGKTPERYGRGGLSVAQRGRNPTVPELRVDSQLGSVLLSIETTDVILDIYIDISKFQENVFKDSGHVYCHPPGFMRLML